MSQRVPVVVLDDARLRSLASDPTFQRDFGLPAIAASKGGCRPCQQRAALRNANTDPIKERILSLSAEKQIAFKNRLNTNRIEMHRLENGTIRKYAF